MKVKMNIMIFCSSVAFSVFIGYKAGQYAGSSKLLLDGELEFYNSQAVHIDSELRLLYLLQNKRYKDSIQYTNGLIDIELASISGYSNISQKHPLPAVYSALESATKYRKQFPYETNELHKDQVNKALRIISAPATSPPPEKN